MTSGVSQATAEPARPPGVGDGRRPRRRHRWLIGGVVLVVAAAAVVALVEPFSGGGKPKPGVVDNAYPTALAKVTRRSLTSRTTVNGKLGYAGRYDIVNAATGTITTLPRAGQVIRPGQVLYRVDGEPVVLLYGRTPAYRTLKSGMTGADVQQLNESLVALGYATSTALDPTSDDFGSATAYALGLLQDALDVEDTGELELGSAVFLPESTRITKTMVTLGARVQPGVAVAEASSLRRAVAVDLDATQQASVTVGDRVGITLPNGRATPGVVTRIGKVASGSSGAATVPVQITPRKPKVTGSLDRATVQVAITTARVKRALVVPVTALLALAGGGYAVETVGAGGVRRLVPVKTGLFDDSDGLVQVSGRLAGGERIVVPSA